MISRREFVSRAGILFAGVAASPFAALAEPVRALDVREIGFATGLSYAKLVSLLKQTFYIHTQAGAVLLAQLIEVSERKTSAQTNARLEQFSAIFQGPYLPQLDSGTYSVEHWLAGRIPLYLAAIPSARYRVDFSLLR